MYNFKYYLVTAIVTVKILPLIDLNWKCCKQVFLTTVETYPKGHT